MKAMPEKNSPYDTYPRKGIMEYAREKAEEKQIVKRQLIKDATSAFMRGQIGLGELRRVQGR